MPGSISAAPPFRFGQRGQDGFHRPIQVDEHGGLLRWIHADHVPGIGSDRLTVATTRVWKRGHGVGRFAMTVPCHPTIVDRGTAATRTAAGRG
jgi:uncharacterized protein YhdP